MAFAFMKFDLLSGPLFTAHCMAFTRISAPLDEHCNIIIMYNYALILHQYNTC